MKKIGIVITDGVGYRNFIISDFITEAQKEFNQVVILSCLPKSAYDSLNINCEIIELDIFNESFATWFFRKAKEVAHLQLHRKGNFGITDNYNINHSKAKTSRGIATRLIYKFTQSLHSEAWISRYNKLQQLTFKNRSETKSYQELLSKLQLNSLVFTHQRPPYIAPLVYAAQQLKITTIAFIFSWDNLASKGRMAASFDKYLVWSELMKKELLTFYTTIKSNQIAVVGTPQFEPYVLSRYGYTKQEFDQKFNLDPENQTLFFSCGDVSTSPNDPLYIETIAKAITEGKFNKKLNFIVRTSPAEEPDRFKDLALKYPFISWNFPNWIQARSNHQESWSQRIPTVTDVNDLKALLNYSTININMLSTMSLDFMLFNKPVINTVFGNNTNGLANDQRFLNYAHIEYVINSKATYLAKNESELIAAITHALANPKAKLEQQKELIDLEIGGHLEGTSKRIIDVLVKWS